MRTALSLVIRTNIVTPAFGGNYIGESSNAIFGGIAMEVPNYGNLS
ncbi:hypothetical protein C8N35_104123 [Breoghania corrubedonensis]|uniref:Uncharacterized protein n=1 Tax=Breoghania corrubedonensis TaxID=665038 RepID=A0A2T5V9T3_9HYPH|nr:hypothetical protein C8N35_104123 [Breoghania corrubedonensis]